MSESKKSRYYTDPTYDDAKCCGNKCACCGLRPGCQPCKECSCCTCWPDQRMLSKGGASHTALKAIGPKGHKFLRGTWIWNGVIEVGETKIEITHEMFNVDGGAVSSVPFETRKKIDDKADNYKYLVQVDWGGMYASSLQLTQDIFWGVRHDKASNQSVSLYGNYLIEMDRCTMMGEAKIEGLTGTFFLRGQPIKDGLNMEVSTQYIGLIGATGAEGQLNECGDQKLNDVAKRFEKKKNYDFFLSHRGPDTKDGFVLILSKALGETGAVSAFFDQSGAGMVLGNKNGDSMLTALVSSECFLCVLSHDYFTSRWCAQELNTAIQLGKPIVFIFATQYRFVQLRTSKHEACLEVPQVLTLFKEKIEPVLKAKKIRYTTTEIGIPIYDADHHNVAEVLVPEILSALQKEVVTGEGFNQSTMISHLKEKVMPTIHSTITESLESGLQIWTQGGVDDLGRPVHDVIGELELRSVLRKRTAGSSGLSKVSRDVHRWLYARPPNDKLDMPFGTATKKWFKKSVPKIPVAFKKLLKKPDPNNPQETQSERDSEAKQKANEKAENNREERIAKVQSDLLKHSRANLKLDTFKSGYEFSFMSPEIFSVLEKWIHSKHEAEWNELMQENKVTGSLPLKLAFYLQEQGISDSDAPELEELLQKVGGYSAFCKQFNQEAASPTAAKRIFAAFNAAEVTEFLSQMETEVTKSVEEYKDFQQRGKETTVQSRLSGILSATEWETLMTVISINLSKITLPGQYMQYKNDGLLKFPDCVRANAFPDEAARKKYSLMGVSSKKENKDYDEGTRAPDVSKVVGSDYFIIHEIDKSNSSKVDDIENLLVAPLKLGFLANGNLAETTSSIDQGKGDVEKGEKAVAASDFVVIVVTNNLFSDKVANAQVAMAIAAEKPIVPIFMPNIKALNMPEKFKKQLGSWNGVECDLPLDLYTITLLSNKLTAAYSHRQLEAYGCPQEPADFSANLRLSMLYALGCKQGAELNTVMGALYTAAKSYREASTAADGTPSAAGKLLGSFFRIYNRLQSITNSYKEGNSASLFNDASFSLFVSRAAGTSDHKHMKELCGDANMPAFAEALKANGKKLADALNTLNSARASHLPFSKLVNLVIDDVLSQRDPKSVKDISVASLGVYRSLWTQYKTAFDGVVRARIKDDEAMITNRPRHGNRPVADNEQNEERPLTAPPRPVAPGGKGEASNDGGDKGEGPASQEMKKSDGAPAKKISRLSGLNKTECGIQCPSCLEDVTTETEHKIGPGVLCLCPLLSCCLVPCQDVKHKCPKCEEDLWKERFCYGCCPSHSYPAWYGPPDLKADEQIEDGIAYDPPPLVENYPNHEIRHVCPKCNRNCHTEVDRDLEDKPCMSKCVGVLTGTILCWCCTDTCRPYRHKCKHCNSYVSEPHSFLGCEHVQN